MKSTTKGALVEAIVAKYLEDAGLIVVEQNFSCRLGEIDIICWEKSESSTTKTNSIHEHANQKDIYPYKQPFINAENTSIGELIFVEVRYRQSNAFGSPLETINYQKQQKLLRTAEVYIQQNFYSAACYEPIYRFDAVGVTGDLDKPKIEWVQNVM